MREWVEYAAVWLLLKTLGMLPRSVARSAAVATVRGLYAFLPKMKKTAQFNLRLAFPELSDKELGEVERKMVRNLGWVAAEFAQFPKYSKENIERFVVLEGRENLPTGSEREKGLLCLGAHIGSWELSSFALALYGLPLHYLARPIENSRIDKLVNRYRCLSGCRPIFKNEAARSILKTLKAAGAIGVLADQNTMPEEGEFVDFFGTSACTTTGIARMALHTGAPVVPTYSFWDEKIRKYRLRLEPPVEIVRTGDLKQDVFENTQKFAKVLERIIREHPEQWVWVHARWKTRPQGEKPLYPFLN